VIEAAEQEARLKKSQIELIAGETSQQNGSWCRNIKPGELAERVAPTGVGRELTRLATDAGEQVRRLNIMAVNAIPPAGRSQRGA